MGSDSSVAITAGAGTPIDAFLLAGGDYQQYVREARATTVATDNWTISTTAATSRLAADVNRVSLLIVVSSGATGRVYFRFDSTAPTSSVFHWFLDPGERWEVPFHYTQLAVSMLGATNAGNVLSTLGVSS